MTTITQPSAGVGPGQPSRTSILVAAARAFGAREPDPKVRNPDWLAERLLGPAELALIGGHPIVAALGEDYAKGRRNPEVAGIVNTLLIRTRFIDEHMVRALDNGATQVVILGAGFDTRAYRYQDRLKEKRVIEVDYRSTQELKRRRVEEALGGLPPNVAYAEIDFKRDALLDVLRNAGWRAEEKTFFVWEGVSLYLSEEAVRQTLRGVAGSAPESSLVMDFAGRATIEILNRFPNHPAHRYTSGWGEPWTFGLPDAREREFFQQSGLELRETLAVFGRESARRYLTRSDGNSLGSVPGGGRQALKMLWSAVPILWAIVLRRSKWYALAEIVVP
jgi:methyltransferase (TIGR00027 family)